MRSVAFRAVFAQCSQSAGRMTRDIYPGEQMLRGRMAFYTEVPEVLQIAKNDHKYSKGIADSSHWYHES